MNWMNPVSLVGPIVCLCQLYNEDEQEIYNVREFIHKIENIIVHISEI